MYRFIVDIIARIIFVRKYREKFLKSAKIININVIYAKMNLCF